MRSDGGPHAARAPPAGRVAQLAHALQPRRRVQAPDAERGAQVAGQPPRVQARKLAAAGLGRPQEVPAELTGERLG